MEEEVKKILADPLLSQTTKRIAESYKRVYADRNELRVEVEKIWHQYNEMYGILIGVMRQLGGEFTLEKKYMPQFDLAQYKVRWEDAPELDAFLLAVKHYTD